MGESNIDDYQEIVSKFFYTICTMITKMSKTIKGINKRFGVHLMFQ